MGKLEPYHKLEYLKGNQYAIRIRKYPGNDNRKKDILARHSSFNNNCTEFALFNLSPNAFKMWCWFNLRRDRTEFALSRQEVCNALNISERTYKTLIKELKDKEFLVPAQLHTGIQGLLFIEEGPLRKLRNIAYEGELDNTNNFQIV